MDSNAALVRLKGFQVEGLRRKVAQLHTMIADFDRLAAELDREIHAEEVRSGNSDPAHYAYPTYAKAAQQRRENLKRSASELAAQLDAAKKTLAEADEELHALAAMDRRDLAGDIVRPRGTVGFDLNRAS